MAFRYLDRHLSSYKNRIASYVLRSEEHAWFGWFLDVACGIQLKFCRCNLSQPKSISGFVQLLYNLMPGPYFRRFHKSHI
uniref:Uncharacterized protein n=1 Tax=Arundo donax TaxID=35708 RepID=A0A0A9BZA2_ARUDO